MQGPIAPHAAPNATAETKSEPADVVWHSLAVEEALEQLNVDRRGLSEAEARERQARFGPNALPEPPRPSLLRRLLRQFDNMLIYVLLAASVVTAVLGHWTDTLVILAVVLINAVIGYWQEGKAEHALAAVRGMLSTEALVIRDGVTRKIPAAALVPGDIVLLAAGDRVPADLRLIEARGLRVQEAALTGESVAVVKEIDPVDPLAALGDRNSMSYSGTLVATGRALGLVVATGAQAEIGRIGAALGRITAITTPLLAQIDRFARLLTAVILGLSVVFFAFAVWVRDYSAADALLAMVGMAVAAIPEGVPAVITITLALGVQRMAARNAIIRRLPAVETLGAVSVICTDKTGTLTLNEMVVRTLVAGTDVIDVTGEGYAPDGRLNHDEHELPQGHPVVELIRAGLLCNDAELNQDPEGLWSVAGDPMEGALLALAAKGGLDARSERNRHRRMDDIPFDAVHRFMATLNAGSNGAMIYVKGAPHRILEMCDSRAGLQGPEPLDTAAWDAHCDGLAGQGQRVLAFACKAADGKAKLDMTDMQSGFTLLGVAGFIDPPRPEAVAAVAECHRAGITVKMITGDHALTAAAIARQIGLDTTNGVLSGAEIETMSDDELRRRATQVAVFARAAPDHKLRLVEALQAEGNIVAMTGDGVNDAPALKRADVGIGMGIKGTEAAKEAAEAILADDNFASIAAAVREGRTIYDNIRKVISWNLPTNGGESLIVIAAILFGVSLPITATQILWINMITATALGLTLAFEPPEPGVMERPPRRRDASLLDAEMVWRTVFVSVLMAAAVFWVFNLVVADAGQAYARTLAVNTIVGMEVFYLFSVRYLHLTSMTWTGVLGTPAVWTGILLCLLFQLAFTYLPFFNTALGSEPLSLAHNVLVLAVGAALLFVLELEKWLRRAVAARFR